MSKINKIFKWNLEQFMKAILGVALFSFAINVFIVPMGLYNGGVLGLSQLIRTFLSDTCNMNFDFDIAGVLNFLINVPLFILAYKKISKTFFARTLLCVSVQTLCLTFIPTMKVPIVTDLLTSTLIGGIIAGLGCGMTLSAGGSGGGTDIIGIVATLKNRNLSVGKLGLMINVVIYAICGFLFGINTMIYSIIYTVFVTFMTDRTHDQNICSTAFIFTKKQPTKIREYITNELGRDTTYWEATGGYKNTKTYITYAVLSKYELQRLERHLLDFDKNAFIVKSNGVGITGEFKKKL